MNSGREMKAEKRFETDLHLTVILYGTRLHISISKSSDRFSMIVNSCDLNIYLMLIVFEEFDVLYY